MKQTRRELLSGIAATAASVGLAGCATAIAGRRRWRTATGLGLYARPAVGSAQVFVTNDDRGLVALDRGSGEQRWTVEVSGDGPTPSGPAVFEDTVIFGGPDGTVHGVAADSGSVRWRYATDGPVVASPVVADGTAVVGSDAGTVHAIDAATGAEQWTVEANGSVTSTATVLDDTVVVGSYEGTVYALDLTSGATRWQFDTGEQLPFRRFAGTSDTVLVGGFDGFLQAFDAETGDPHRIEVPTDSRARTVVSPSVVGETVYAVRPGGVVHAIDVRSGDVRWSFDADGGRPNTVTAVDDGVFLTTDDEVYALSPEGGDRRWSYETEWEMFAPPRVTQDWVFVGTRKGTVVALSRGI